MAAREASLEELLSSSLPRGHSFQYHHVSTPPASCAALYSPLPGHKPEKTTCESHMLNVSISPGNDFQKQDAVAIFAIEVYIYRTRHLTTLFVSKADTTGWISLLDLPKRFASVIKTISSAFVSYLIRKSHRPDRRLVLSLFARAQSQYLYPGSDENPKKHILDDRQLVKWWCRTLDPVLREYEGEEQISTDGEIGNEDDLSKVRSKAYLIVPGHDRYETNAFFPQSARSDPADNKRWHAGHPLRELATFPNAPPRCLIPHFPDDPKSRFLLDLDIELSDAPPPHISQPQSQSSQSSSQHALLNPQESPSKRGKGQWKSVKTLEQFWEMMAFRQECSSGRLVGFLWMVFTPDSLEDSPEQLSVAPLEKVPHLAPPRTKARPPAVTPRKKIASSSTPTTPATGQTPTATSNTGTLKKRRKHLATSKKAGKRIQRRKGRRTGVIIPREPRIKQSWPTGEPGVLRLTPRAYARVHEVLLRLDFASETIARQSTSKWVAEAGIIGGTGSKDWGIVVMGQAPYSTAVADGESQSVTTLGVKRKAADLTEAAAVNVLGGGMVRKKVKPTSDTDRPMEASGTGQEKKEGEAQVNTLNGNLVRRKPKA